MAMIAANVKPPKTKSSKKRKSSSTSTKKSQKRLEAPKEQKLLEYRPGSNDGKEGEAPAGQMVVYKPRADHFLSFVNKGPESERGCSIHKVLKRYHRERTETGMALSKLMEEKELWRSLRLRKNERGEIVLFSI
jgi:cell growth-regulating nucleolar protein